MKRKLIAFDAGDLAPVIEKRAEDEGVSVSEFIRESLRTTLKITSTRLLKVEIVDGSRRMKIGEIEAGRIRGRG